MDDSRVLELLKKYNLVTNKDIYIPDPLFLHLLIHDDYNIDKIKSKNKENLNKNLQFYPFIIDDHWSLFMYDKGVLYHLNSFQATHKRYKYKVLNISKFLSILYHFIFANILYSSKIIR